MLFFVGHQCFYNSKAMNLPCIERLHKKGRTKIIYYAFLSSLFVFSYFNLSTNYSTYLNSDNGYKFYNPTIFNSSPTYTSEANKTSWFYASRRVYCS